MKKHLGLRYTFILLAACGWWGLLYPELVLTPETVKVLTIDESGEELLSEEIAWDDAFYSKLLQADCNQLVVRSKFLQRLNAHLSKHTK